MKILGGNQVVFYASKAGTYEEQLSDCLVQLEEYMDANQIYPGSFIRHNIFVDVADQAKFTSVVPKLKILAKRRFPMPLIINVIPNSPADGTVALESTHLKSTQWNCLFKESKNGSCQHIIHAKKEVVIGSVQIDSKHDFQTSVENAFTQIDELLSLCSMGFENIIKQWNYIGRMFDDELKVQRYQIFNDVRTKYYDNDFAKTGYPASTEVGMKSDGIIIEFFAIKKADEVSKAINSPLQKAPHEYSSEVLSKRGVFSISNPTTPKVERARFLTLNDLNMVFISATAAIVGERVTSAGDVKEQTVIIIENLKKMISAANLQTAGIHNSGTANYTLVKAYVQKRKDFMDVFKVLDPFFKNVPLVLIQAELPRKDILVEIEAELMLG